MMRFVLVQAPDDSYSGIAPISGRQERFARRRLRFRANGGR